MRARTDEKPLKCNDCHQRFKYRRDLRRHEKTHSDDRVKKSFECNHCEVKFYAKNDLRVHIINKHSKNDHIDDTSR